MAFAISGQPHFIMSKRTGINEGYDHPMNRPGPGYLNSAYMRNEVTPSSVNPWENNFKPKLKRNILGVFYKEKELEPISLGMERLELNPPKHDILTIENALKDIREKEFENLKYYGINIGR